MRIPTAFHRARRLLAPLLATSALMLSSACATSPAAPSSGGTTDSTFSANLSASLSYCADQVNKYRATVNLPPLGRAPDLEAFAATAAEYDGKAGVPHGYFVMTNGAGVSMAENQLLLWKGYAVNDVIHQGMELMWAEGPSGSHYQVLTGKYTQVGCGIYLNGNEVNVSQDFR